MNGMQHDFAGHPPRPKLGIPVVLGFVFLASLGITAWWADSQYAALYKAQAIAEKQMGRTGP